MAKKSKNNGKSVAKKGGPLTFMGWRRENGRVGVRNHVIILPLRSEEHTSELQSH